jgi:LCP family protein required for cell wall assembly
LTASSFSRIPPQKKKKRKIWRWVLLFFVFILAAVAGAIFASSSLLDKPLEKAAEEGLLVAKDKSTIMIMGVDERDDDVGRSDTLMIATVDPRKDQAALLSVPRDTRVKIKGHGYDKINAAYAYGGHKLTQDTVEKLLGTPMDHYVLINIKAFKRIVDAIGGVDIDVEKRMYYEDPWDDEGGLVIDLYPGKQHMDGDTAITYVRYRDEEGDIGRIARQQKFMKAVMDKVASPSIIPQLPGVIREVMSSVKTDLSFRELLEFAGTLREAQKNGLKTEMLQGRPLYIEGISYWIPDISKIRSTLANTLGINMSQSARNAMEREQREYENSIPSGATEIPAGENSIGSYKKSSSARTNSNSTNRKSGTSNSDTRSTEGTQRRPSTSPSQQPSTSPVQPSNPAPSPTPSATGGGKTM